MFCAENVTPHLRTAGGKTRNCQPGGYFNLYVQGFTLKQREMEMEMGLLAWSEFQIQATTYFYRNMLRGIMIFEGKEWNCRTGKQ